MIERKLVFQDPAMPSQEPPLDAKSEEVDLPPDDTEDTDGSKELKGFSFVGWFGVLVRAMSTTTSVKGNKK